MLKKGSHLDGVEPINELIIDNKEFIQILNDKIGDGNTLKYIKQLIKGTKIYDKSGYSGNSVLIAKCKTNTYVIKVSKNGELFEEYIAYNYFYKNGLTSKPIQYFKENDYEIMITEFIDLPTAGNYFDSYQSIAEFLGKELYKFHKNNFNNFNEEELELFNTKFDRSLNRALDNDVPLIYMVMYLGEDNVEKMKKYLIDNKEMLHKNEVFVHGDINPNNIFIDSNQNLKYIDFCDTGFCNKHYDIFWTLFMIIIFSGIIKEKDKIKECEDIFIKAYGEENINEDELLFFKYFTCLYWKQHDEITRINIL